jgi:hypothetical protein
MTVAGSPGGWFASGGATAGNSSAQTATDGGGGSGSVSGGGADATANTGGGGGGSRAGASGAGGSGVVVFKYAGFQRATGGTITTTGGFTYHLFTTSGTFTVL